LFIQLYFKESCKVDPLAEIKSECKKRQLCVGDWLFTLSIRREPYLCSG